MILRLYLHILQTPTPLEAAFSNREGDKSLLRPGKVVLILHRANNMERGGAKEKRGCKKKMGGGRRKRKQKRM
jgi:hypothetical protein